MRNDNMMNQRHRASSMSSAFSGLHISHTLRRANSATLGLSPRSVRVVVLGVGGVGKTAMVVRYVTKRYIGDYDPSLETIYRHTAVVDDQLVNFEIMDTAGQEENSVLLEDKCKWGESFIFVYDVTDKYSFDELTRLKFIASYTHAKMRVNYKPCWILIGNKTDLADRDRMVTTEEGMALARDLGCHMFREISVKESMNDASTVFEDLWREFSRLSPRSPSTSQRRKNSCKIQDKIAILDSEACTCASEALKTISHGNHNHINEALVTTLASTLKRQCSSFSTFPSPRPSRRSIFKHTNHHEDFTTHSIRHIHSIAEHMEEENDEISVLALKFQRPRKNAVIHVASTGQLSPLRSFTSQIMSAPSSVAHSPPCQEMRTSLMSTSSSSSTSLNSLTESNSDVSERNSKSSSIGRARSSSDASSLRRRNSDKSNQLTTEYHEHCRRHRMRVWDLKKCHQEFSRAFKNSSFTNVEVHGFC